MRTKLSVAVVLMTAVALAGCTTQTSTEVGLEMDQAVLVKQAGDGSFQAVEDRTFSAGEQLAYMMQNVQGFTQKDDGSYEYDINAKLTGPNGNDIFDRQNILGDRGNVNLSDGTASPQVMFRVTESMAPGQYTISMTVHDQVGDGSASASTTFQVEATSDTDGTDSGTNETVSWTPYSVPSWNISMAYPASWTTSVRANRTNTFSFQFQAPSGMNVIVAAQRVVKRGLANWTQQIADNTENANISTTIHDGSIVADSKVIEIERANRNLDQEIVVTLREHGQYETLYTFTFTTSLDSYSADRARFFAPMLQRVEVTG